MITEAIQGRVTVKLDLDDSFMRFCDIFSFFFFFKSSKNYRHTENKAGHKKPDRTFMTHSY